MRGYFFLVFLFISIYCENNCGLTNYTILEDKEEGLLKVPSNPCVGVVYSYTIYPRENHIVQLRFERYEDKNMYFKPPYKLTVHYFEGNRHQEDMIFMANATEILASNFGHPSTVFSPSNFGFYVQFTAHANLTDFELDMKFSRDQTSNARYLCPYPFLNITTEHQLINMSQWSATGCALRFSANWNKIHSIYAFFHNDTENSIVWYKAVNYPGSAEHSYGLEMKERGLFNSKKLPPVTSASHRWTVKTRDFEMYISMNPYHVWKDKKPISIMEYYASEEDPCICNTYNTTIRYNEPLMIMSPGYPYLICPGILCNYSFKREEYDEPNYVFAFIITAIYSPKSYEDSLTLSLIGEKEISLGSKSSPREKYESLTFYENQINLKYRAASVLKDNHGFSMKLAIAKIPTDCACPSTSELLSTEGNYTLNLSAHCPEMSCRFVISAPTLQKTSTWLFRKFLRIHYSYKLPDEAEYLDFYKNDKEELVLTGGVNEWQHGAENMESANSVEILYVRRGRHGRQTESNMNLRWEWISTVDCFCDTKTLHSTPDWQPLYSPHYPSNYCPNMNCEYLITAPTGWMIVLSIPDFLTGKDDVLSIYDGYNKSNLIARLTETLPTPWTTETTSSGAVLTFTSNSYDEYHGFKILYKTVPVQDSTLFWILVALVLVVVACCIIPYLVYRQQKRKIVMVNFERYELNTLRNEEN